MKEEAAVPRSVNEVFLVMQGGGAKGIAHAGGIIAIEKEELSIKGIAGTSAGSIAAALVAAGYTGKQLADPIAKTHIFQLPPFGTEKGQLPYTKPTHLFTWFGWRVLHLLRSVSRFWQCFLFPVKSRVILSIYWATLLLLSAGSITWAVIWAPEKLHMAGSYLKMAIQLSAPWVLAGVIFCAVWALWGITSVRNIRKIIDLILARKLSDRLKAVGIVKEKNITFRDMERAGCPPLKIIATNTATESLELFCAERTPDVAVADAVAASICLPLIFKPKRLTFIRHTPVVDTEIKGKFLDGGLVSNLPAWALDEERLLHPGVPTIALSLSPPAPMNNKFWFSALAGTIVNGSSEIHTRTPSQILTVALETKATLLDFDLSAKKVFEEVTVAQNRVTQELSRALQGPGALKTAMEELHDQVQTVFAVFSGSLYKAKQEDRVRVALAVQRGSSMKTLSTAFAHGYRLDADANLTVLIKGSHPGEAWDKNEIIIDDVINGKAQRFQLSSEAWPAMTWLLCFPICPQVEKGRKARPLVITVDCNVQFDRDNPDFEQLKEKFSSFIRVTVQAYTEKIDLLKYTQGANTWL